MTNIESWDRIAARSASDPPTDVVMYAPEGPSEDELRLLGEVKGKRVVDLGCGSGQAAVSLAREGATVIAVDASNQMLERARRLAERHEARVEWHQSDLADLAFLRADSIDIALSVYALGEVDDLGRLLRQVHRVLRHRAPFVCSYEHPMSLCMSTEETESTEARPGRHVMQRSYFGEGPVTVDREGEPVQLFMRPVADVFAEFARAGFRVDAIVEPRPTADAVLPSTIIWRARKEGV